jgi:hypothetical protein
MRRIEPLAFTSMLKPEGLSRRRGKTTGDGVWEFMGASLGVCQDEGIIAEKGGLINTEGSSRAVELPY